MGEHNSPYFAAGLEDGETDKLRIESCPPLEPLGGDAQREWSWMYRKGYQRALETAVPHVCDDSCKQNRDAS